MRYNKNEHRFAVVQFGHTLYGVGKTKEEAKKMASEWIDPNCDVEKLLNHGHGKNVQGEFYLIEDPETIREYIITL